MAVMEWLPFGTVRLSHRTVNGAAVTSLAAFLPSIWNCTPATPTLSLAFAVKVTVPAIVCPLTGEETDTVGGCVSCPPVEEQLCDNAGTGSGDGRPSNR